MPRNPHVVPSRFRTSAGPMKAGKKRLHKKLRENNRKVIEEDAENIKDLGQDEQLAIGIPQRYASS